MKINIENVNILQNHPAIGYVTIKDLVFSKSNTTNVCREFYTNKKYIVIDGSTVKATEIRNNDEVVVAINEHKRNTKEVSFEDVIKGQIEIILKKKSEIQKVKRQIISSDTERQLDIENYALNKQIEILEEMKTRYELFVKDN